MKKLLLTVAASALFATGGQASAQTASADHASHDHAASSPAPAPAATPTAAPEDCSTKMDGTGSAKPDMSAMPGMSGMADKGMAGKMMDGKAMDCDHMMGGGDHAMPDGDMKGCEHMMQGSAPTTAPTPASSTPAKP